MKKFLGISLTAILAMAGYMSAVRQSHANVESNLLMENVEALSYGSELIFTDVCFINYLEANSVFEQSLVVRKCLPCGELVRIRHAQDSRTCSK